jgi:alpha-amylase
MKSSICLYFQVHQPRRLGQFSFFDIGTSRDYFDDGLNQLIIRRIAKECYLPVNLSLLQLIKRYPQVKITFSISGVALRQLELWAPSVLESFRMLASTGSVEFLAETFYHSLSCFISRDEFEDQVISHSKKIKELFDVTPAVFRNTELLYSDAIGDAITQLGFAGTIIEHVDASLVKNSGESIYKHPANHLILIPRNRYLSDEVAFRYRQHSLTASTYTNMILNEALKSKLTTIAMDYETFGEHLKKETGVISFLNDWLTAMATHQDIAMMTASEAISVFSKDAQELRVLSPTSWADASHDASAWLGNDLQKDALRILSSMEELVYQTSSDAMMKTWRYLQTSDHFYYMYIGNNQSSDAAIHNYFSPYSSPYDAFMNYMNVLSDFEIRLRRQVAEVEKLNWQQEHMIPESLLA